MSDLRDALSEALDQQGKQDSDPVEKAEAGIPVGETSGKELAPAEGQEENKTSRDRDENGRFKARAQTEPDFVKKDQEQETKALPRNSLSSWKPAAQAALMKAERGEQLTVDEIKLIRTEAERRESDFHKGVNEFKGHSDRARMYDQAFAPFQAHMQKLGVDAPTAITALMKADVVLRTGDPATKAAYFAKLAREYGIDLTAAQEAPKSDPMQEYILQQMNDLRRSQETWHNNIAQQQAAEAEHKLQAFIDSGKPHFEDVRNDMAQLLETGRAKTLEEAYDMAVWAKPEIRSSLIADQVAEAQRVALEKLDTQRAKSASVSVKGSSPISTGAPVNGGSLRDIIAANLE